MAYSNIPPSSADSLINIQSLDQDEEFQRLQESLAHIDADAIGRALILMFYLRVHGVEFAQKQGELVIRWPDDLYNAQLDERVNKYQSEMSWALSFYPEIGWPQLQAEIYADEGRIDVIDRMTMNSLLDAILTARSHPQVHDDITAVEHVQGRLSNFFRTLVDQARQYRYPYHLYLKTGHWGTTRAAALQRAQHRCELCNATDRLQVHHKTYERLWQEQPQDLIVLCRNCHAKFHDKLPY